MRRNVFSAPLFPPLSLGLFQTGVSVHADSLPSPRLRQHHLLTATCHSESKEGKPPHFPSSIPLQKVQAVKRRNVKPPCRQIDLFRSNPLEHLASSCSRSLVSRTATILDPGHLALLLALVLIGRTLLVVPGPLCTARSPRRTAACSRGVFTTIEIVSRDLLGAARARSVLVMGLQGSREA
jgi:hypothetical protein